MRRVMATTYGAFDSLGSAVFTDGENSRAFRL